MGQIVRRNRKGRPAKTDPALSEADAGNDLRRSLRRRNVKYVFDLDDYFDEDDVFAYDVDQRRREKKLKHLLKLQNGGERESTGEQACWTRRVDHAPASSSDEDKPWKKRRIEEDMDGDDDDVNGEDNYNDDEIRDRKPETRNESSHTGTPEAASSLPLPDRKTLELILDKLQKKDIYGVYAEPVDPEELPDYHDVIEHPMDFATVRNKLRNGSYALFEQFESDVFLICSNAMQYNAPDTIYHKQARSIEELAKKKFEKIRLNAERIEKEFKTEQRFRSGSNSKKLIKKCVTRTVQETVGSEFSSGATLATTADIQIQNAPSALQVVGSEKLSGIDALVEGNSLVNDNNVEKGEESLSGKGLPIRFSKKPSIQDENRRATYSISLCHEQDITESIFSTFEGEPKHLVPVGLYSDHSYARSLARFASTLGSVAWRVASKRIELALPQGFKFGRGGWVGEYEPLPTPVIILENCNVKEPPYLAKVLPASDSRKLGMTPTILVPSSESSGNDVTIMDKKFPFHGPTGIRPPPVSDVTVQPIRSGNVSELKGSFFLSPKARPSSSPNFSPRHQNLQSRAFVAESDRKVPKQTELNGPPSLQKNAANSLGNRHILQSSEIEASMSVEFSSKKANISQPGPFKQLDSSGASFGGLRDGNVTGNTVGGNTMAISSSDLERQASNYLCQQGQTLTDPVQSMRKSSGKAQNQQKASTNPPVDSQVLPSAPSLSGNDSNNAATAAAGAWMSVGAGGFRTVVSNPNLNKNQVHVDSLYNSTRDKQPQVSQFHSELPASMNVGPDKNSTPTHAFVPQGQIPMMVGSAMPFQNQRMVFPQFATADLSRFQMQSTWRNLSPQMLNQQILSRQKQESLPPDLNIGFQPSGSPGRPSSGVLVDSQQPDLALQL